MAEIPPGIRFSSQYSAYDNQSSGSSYQTNRLSLARLQQENIIRDVALHWHSLGLELYINPEDLGIIENDSQRDSEKGARKMLEKWLRDFPDQASAHSLCQALYNINLRHLASKIRKKLETDANYLSESGTSGFSRQRSEATLNSLGQQGITRGGGYTPDVSAPGRGYTGHTPIQGLSSSQAVDDNRQLAINDLRAQVSMLNGQLEEQSQRINQLQSDNHRLQYSLSSKDNEIKKINEECDELRRRVKFMTSEPTPYVAGATRRTSSDFRAALPSPTIRQAPQSYTNTFLADYESGIIGLGRSPLKYYSRMTVHLVNDWETIALNLGIQDCRIKVIKADNPANIGNCIRTMIKDWQQLKPNDTNRNFAYAVYKALENEDLQKAIELGKKCLYLETS